MTATPSTSFFFPFQSLPRKAKAVVVGGGIVGSSVAYHLAKQGWQDVVLLEQNKLAGGTTWHAAGMVGRLRTSSAMVQIAEHSAKLYASLHEETGHDNRWRQVGSLIVARNEKRLDLLRRNAAMAQYFGVEVNIVSPDEAKKHWPLIQADDLVGAAWIPGDGKVNPKETGVALAKGAAKHGATVIEDVRVNNIIVKDGRAVGVQTSRGDIQAEYVVICGGMWARQLGLKCGVNLPLHAVEHHYIVSEPIEGAFDELPCLRDPDGLIYARGEGDAVVLGAFQEYTKPWMVDQVPSDFSFGLLEDDWEKYEQPLAEGKHRIPALRDCKWAKFVNGPESFTPDNNFLLGETPTVKQLFVACGFNSVGIAAGGGAGMMLARWMEEGKPPIDLWALDVRRFAPFHNNRAFLRDRVTEMLGLHYVYTAPNHEPKTGRNLRQSPLHERLAAQGACFGTKMGLERPIWFANKGQKPIMDHSFGRQNWFDNHAAEHRAAREAIAVFDQTSFSKFVLKGPDACKVLQRLCGNDVDKPIGSVIYTGMFNDSGTFESDLTVIRMAEDTYYIVTSTAQTVRDIDWITRNMTEDDRAELVNVTPQFSVIGVMGPNARAVLSELTETDLSLDAFAFGTARHIGVGKHMALAARVTYVGELGWELHVGADQTLGVYDAIMEAGASHGIRNAGHYAINSLRLEKAYRAWGSDVSPDDTPLQAGLSFALAWDKQGGFMGRDALLKQREQGIRKRMAAFVLDDPQPILWGHEIIYRDGQVAGYTSSASYGHTVGGAVALGYVKSKDVISRDWIEAGRYEIAISAKRHAATVHWRSPYDPKRARILI